MATLIFSNWTANFRNAFTASQFQAFQALIARSPLLVDLLNSFSGSVDTSGAGLATFFNKTNNTIYIGGALLTLAGPEYPGAVSASQVTWA